jgi:hypothetical protein
VDQNSYKVKMAMRVNTMGDECRNPYRGSVKPNTHSPTSEEFYFFKSELDVRNWELLDNG